MTPIDDFEVADLGLAAAGRRQTELAETEMPGLMGRFSFARGVVR
ncbi:adenosylhomocysteinase [Candidatus Poriferisodalis sp.]